jgi:hypothetical protein
MSVQAVLAPVFVQVALTFVLLFWMGSARLGAIRHGEARVRDIALGEPNWPARVTQVANCFHNQFQLPMLFYVAVALAVLTRKADVLFVLLSWAFVLLRIVHAVIHTGSNHVPYRFYAFLAGALALVTIWLTLLVRILIVPG